MNCIPSHPTDYVMTDSNIYTAVEAWCDNKTTATHTFGGHSNYSTYTNVDDPELGMAAPYQVI